MIILNKQEPKVGDYIFAWSGNPYKKNWWDKDYTCEIPPGEPTGENNIPGFKGITEDLPMILLKQKYCYARLKLMEAKTDEEKQKAQEECDKYLRYISELKQVYADYKAGKRRDLADKIVGIPGELLSKTLTPIVKTIAVVGGIAVVLLGTIMYISYRTKTTQTITEMAKRRILPL